MKTKLFDQSGQEIGEVSLPNKIFALNFNRDLVHQVLLAQLANSRKVLAHAKGRGEVRGGGKKPWRQKGTGRARHGSIRSPIWKGGGVTFGPTRERNFSKKINKKMKKQALLMSLSDKIRSREFMLLDSLKLDDAKTRIAANTLKSLSTALSGFRSFKKKQDSVLLITARKDNQTNRAFNNLPFAKIISADSLNLADVLASKYMILVQEAIPVIEKNYFPR